MPLSRPQEAHADLGLIEDDNTPDMRKAPVAPDALQKFDHRIRITEQEA